MGQPCQSRMTVAAILPHRAMVLVPPTDADRTLRGGIASGGWSFVLDAGHDETTGLVMLVNGVDCSHTG